MCNQHRLVPAERHKIRQRLVLQRGILHHVVFNAGQLGDLRRNLPLRIHKGIESFHHFQSAHLYRTNFNHPVGNRRKPCGFQIKNNQFIRQRSCQRLGYTPLNRLCAVVYLICLDAKQQLKFAPGTPNGIHLIHGIRISLTHAMIGNGKCGMSPLVSSAHQLVRRRYGIHHRHIRMTMQFHTLLRCFVMLFHPFHQQHIRRLQIH